MTEEATSGCSIARSLEVVGDRWTLLILRDLFTGMHRFEEFRTHLGIARNILSSRLNRLVQEEITERRRYQTSPDRSEYWLTAKGRALQPVIMALMAWGDDYLAGPDGPPVVLLHRTCGYPTRPGETCSHCGGELRPRNLAALPRGEGSVLTG